MKGQNQVGVAAESRTVDRRDVEKVASVDRHDCMSGQQGYDVEDRVQRSDVGFKLGGVINRNILRWEERLLLKRVEALSSDV